MSKQAHDPQKQTDCKYCGHSFYGHYCNFCGQRASTKRFDLHYILFHEVPHAVTHLDRGFFYTLKMLFTRPGAGIREYIGGKRARHFGPIGCVMILALVHVWLSSVFKIDWTAAMAAVTGLGTDRVNVNVSALISEWTQRNPKLVALMLVPVTSLFTWLFFKRARLNYAEHLVINLFVHVMGQVVSILLVPAMWHGLGHGYFGWVLGVKRLASLAIHTVVTCQYFWPFYEKKWAVVWRSVLAYVLSFVAISLTVGLVFAIYLLRSGQAH